jgi:hypothetical protein
MLELDTVKNNIEFPKEIELIRDKVESALHYFGDESSPSYNLLHSFNGQLSTNPERVGKIVTRDTLTEQCVIISDELKRNLKKVGLNSKKVSNALGNHTYLITQQNEEIIIDPTAGQFLEGHNHVFIGTRDMLKKITKDYARKGKLYSPMVNMGHAATYIPHSHANIYFNFRWGYEPQACE